MAATPMWKMKVVKFYIEKSIPPESGIVIS